MRPRTSRSLHFVGSIPADGAEEAMRSMLSWGGPYVRSVTDGEVGDQGRWIADLVNGFAEHPDLTLVSKGEWSNYRDIPRFRVRRGHRLDAGHLDFRRDTDALAALPVFRALRAESRRDDLSFQVGIPGDLDLALFTFGPLGALRHRAVFRQVLAREIRHVHAEAGDDVIFQIEMPAELIVMCRTPRPLCGIMAVLLARGVTKLIRQTLTGTRFGLHLCLGDLNHESLGKPRTTRPLVQIANALARQWPPGRPLEYLHAPLTGGADPVPAEPAYYTPLRDLHLHPRTRFIAGLVQETSTTARLRHALELTETAYGEPVDIAAGCGLARRTPEAAAANAELSRMLCEDAP